MESRDEPQRGAVENAVRTYSSPSDLKITDMRTAVVESNFDYPIIRIDTNQGVYGIGEVRDAGHPENALQFKSLLLGQNPCNVDMIFRAIKRYGGSGREGGGVSGIEIALWDLVGKVYGMQEIDAVELNPDMYQLLLGRPEDPERRAYTRWLKTDFTMTRQIYSAAPRFNDAVGRGVVVVNSAGNEGGGDFPHVIAPADGDSVIAVGAVDSLNVVAGFSSRGPTADGRTKPEVVGPGVDDDDHRCFQRPPRCRRRAR